MNAPNVVLAIVLGLLAGGVIVLWVWYTSLQAEYANLVRQNAKLRQRLMRAEAHNVRMTTALESYVNQFATAAAELDLVAK